MYSVHVSVSWQADVSFFPELNEIGAELANSLHKGEGGRGPPSAAPLPGSGARLAAAAAAALPLPTSSPPFDFFPILSFVLRSIAARARPPAALLTFPALGASFPH